MISIAFALSPNLEKIDFVGRPKLNLMLCIKFSLDRRQHLSKVICKSYDFL